MPPNTLNALRSSTLPRPIRPFAVVASITSTASFLVDARSQEEAEGIVEEWVQEGETGTISETDVTILDCYPTEDDSMNAPLNRSKFKDTTLFPEDVDPASVED